MHASKKPSLCILLFVIAFFNLHSAEQRPLIKAARITDDRIYTRFKDGKDFFHQYLQMASRYTNWDYEFSDLTWAEALQKLQNNTIDVIPFVEEDIINSISLKHSRNPTFISHLVLASNHPVKDDSTLKIGIIDSRKEIQNFNENPISFKYILTKFSSLEQLISAQENGTVDAVCISIIYMPKEYSVLAYLSQIRYFAAFSSRTKYLPESWDKTVSEITALNPDGFNELTQNSFPMVSSLLTMKNYDEEKYLAALPVLKIAVTTDHAPFCYYEEGTYKGIYIDLLKRIEYYSGIHFLFISAPSYTDALLMLDAGTVDAVYAATKFILEDNPDKYIITIPYYTTSFSSVGSWDDFDETKNLTIALPENYQHIKNVAQLSYPGAKIKIYASIPACLHALNKNNGTIALVNSIDAENADKSRLYGKLFIIPLSFSSTFHIVLAKHHAYPLCSILDKAIRQIRPDEQDHIIIKYMSERSLNSTAEFFAEHPYLSYMLEIIIVAMIITIIFLILMQRLRIKKNAEIMRIMDIANRDSMTGLFNRITFTTMVDQILKSRNPHEPPAISAFIMIDVDNFKHVNDTYGHGEGDKLLISLSDILHSCFRRGDITARMGGDEFAIFITQIGDRDALAERLDGLIKEISGKIKITTCSIGASVTSAEHTDSFSSMYKEADDALYHVKKSGKNSFWISGTENKIGI